MIDVSDLLNRLENVEKSGNGWTAKCPGHDDRHNSLSIGIGDDGNVLLKCHAGCDTGKIIDRLGLSMQDLFQDKPKRERRQIVATYMYPAGVQKLRYSDKSFVWRRPDGKGGWVWNRQGVPHSLYIAGELSGAVCICEGKKDCDGLHMLGFDAVSGEDGAGPGKWRAEYTEQLKGRSVVIFPDNDRIGKDYADETAAALRDVCQSVQVLDLSAAWPEIPAHGDVSDLIGKFGAEQAATVIVVIAKTPQWTPPDTENKPRLVRACDIPYKPPR